MGINARERKVVEGVFRAMQSGPGGEEALMALFDERAVFVEPFSGEPHTHVGKDAIRGSFRDQWKDPLPDFRLRLDRVDLDGRQVRAEWTCTSSVFPTPMRGYDLFTLNDDGKIARFEIIVTEAPSTDR
jgi:SnoaL-like domain